MHDIRRIYHNNHEWRCWTSNFMRTHSISLAWNKNNFAVYWNHHRFNRIRREINLCSTFATARMVFVTFKPAAIMVFPIPFRGFGRHTHVWMVCNLLIFDRMKPTFFSRISDNLIGNIFACHSRCEKEMNGYHMVWLQSMLVGWS